MEEARTARVVPRIDATFRRSRNIMVFNYVEMTPSEVSDWWNWVCGIAIVLSGGFMVVGTLLARRRAKVYDNQIAVAGLVAAALVVLSGIASIMATRWRQIARGAYTA